MSAWRDEVRAALRDEAWSERLVALARNTVRATPGWEPGLYDDETLRQSIRGFVGLMSEALDARDQGETGPSWHLFMTATVPAYAAAGPSQASLVGASTSFLVLLTVELMTRVSGPSRDEALHWLGAFAGRYVSDVCAAVDGPSA